MTAPRFETRTLETTRTARWAMCGEPGPGVRELWVVAHGYRQLAARFLSRFVPIAAPHRVIVAPEALNRFYVGDAPGRHGPDAKVGGTWMTREAREEEIADYVAWLDRLTGHVSESLRSAGASGWRTVALGFSQGAHTVARWASIGATEVDDLVLWGEHLPHDLDEARAAARWTGKVRVHLVRGTGDRWHAEETTSREVARLGRMGVESEVHLHVGGHEIPADAIVRLAEALRAG